MLVIACLAWGLGPHHGLIVPRRSSQPSPQQWVQALTQIDATGLSLTDQVVYI